MNRGLLLLVFIALAHDLAAAPKLRLANTVIGPVSIVPGSNASTQTIETYNAGDGALNLVLSTNVKWISASLGSVKPYSSRTVVVGFETASLEPGTYTGVVTVSDPSAVDAPQTITVSVQIGGGIPDRLDLYVPVNGSNDGFHFKTNSAISGIVLPIMAKRGYRSLWMAPGHTRSFTLTASPLNARLTWAKGVMAGKSK